MLAMIAAHAMAMPRMCFIGVMKSNVRIPGSKHRSPPANVVISANENEAGEVVFVEDEGDDDCVVVVVDNGHGYTNVSM